MSPVAQQRHCFAVGKLPDRSTLSEGPLQDALIDNTRTPPGEQVCFRLDFPAWLRAHTERDHRLIDHLMVGERALDVSRKFGLSPSRVSQKRREFHDDWTRFCGEAAS